MPQKIEFILNESPISVTVDPERPLVDVLREDLDLTGTKRGCDYAGQCGACTVIVDGQAVRACRLPVRQVAGKHVTTIEGLSQSDRLHPLQQAFIDCGAVQCGYCTPGMIMSAKALLDRNPSPSREDVRRALSGNLCRCTGYVKIVDAVLAAAAGLRDEKAAGETQYEHVVGRDARRLDAVDKVLGRARFAGDVKMAGMLHAALVRSPHAHARIVEIDAGEALRVPGVEAVYTAADVPGTQAFTDTWAARNETDAEHPSLAYEPVLAIDRVRMVGEPVAMVVAASPEAARAGVERVHVTYEPLEPVLDPEKALEPSAPQLHETGNLYEYGAVKAGDYEAAQAAAEVRVETQYTTTGRDHATIERESAVAYADEDGRVVVIGPTHESHMRQRQIAEMLAVPPEQVRVIVPPLGGSFGGRHHHWLIVAAALPAYLLKRPVRLVYTRRETFEATWKSFPFRLRHKLGARRDGTLTSLWARAYGDAGPYGGAPVTAPFVALCGCGPYVWQGVDNEAYAAHTNNANAGSIRGYGMPQGVIGIECALDEMAVALGRDPWALRMQNAADETTGICTGQPFDDPFGFKEVLHAIHPDWRTARARVESHRDAEGAVKYGAGLAANWYQFGKSGELRVSAQAELLLNGRFALYYAVQNSGQGLNTVMSQFAAEALGVPRTLIDLFNSDTDLTPDSHIYGACRSTYWVGGAIAEAARALKQTLLRTAAEMLDAPPARLCVAEEGVVIAEGTQSVSFEALAAELERVGQPRKHTGTYDLEARYSRAGRPRYLGHFSVGAAVAEVSVDLGSGLVRAEHIAVAQDVGRAINPIDVRGQIEGAVVMELGAALLEAYRARETLDFKRYRIPRTGDVPPITVRVVEVPSKDGPLGAKGVGEAMMGHVRAAILNAIYDATGVRVRATPATPERVLAALEGR